MPTATTDTAKQPAQKSPKTKTRGFFAWARRNKKPVEVAATRLEPPEAALMSPAESEPEDNPKVTLQQLKQGYGEVLETMKAVRAHMDETAERNRQMLEIMDTLPGLLRDIPEATRAQSLTLELINQQLQSQGETNADLTRAVSDLTTAAGTQGLALDGIRDHLADGEQTRQQLNQTLSETRTSMAGVAEQTKANDQRMREMYQRNQRVNTALMAVCLVLAVGAISLGGYVAYLVSHMGG
ncbi:MAG: hypothetical protein AAGH88_02195 [Planctomycetota bacterium]